MSYIPNVREKTTVSRFTGEQEENVYYEGNLKKEQVPYKVGFDTCRESLENFFYNLDVYEEDLEDIFDVSAVNMDLLMKESVSDEEIDGATLETRFMIMLKDVIMNWTEMERNEFIVALIEGDD